MTNFIKENLILLGNISCMNTRYQVTDLQKKEIYELLTNNKQIPAFGGYLMVKNKYLIPLGGKEVIILKRENGKIVSLRWRGLSKIISAVYYKTKTSGEFAAD